MRMVQIWIGSWGGVGLSRMVGLKQCKIINNANQRSGKVLQLGGAGNRVKVQDMLTFILNTGTELQGGSCCGNERNWLRSQYLQRFAQIHRTTF